MVRPAGYHLEFAIQLAQRFGWAQYRRIDKQSVRNTRRQHAPHTRPVPKNTVLRNDGRGGKAVPTGAIRRARAASATARRRQGGTQASPGSGPGGKRTSETGRERAQGKRKSRRRSRKRSRGRGRGDTGSRRGGIARTRGNARRNRRRNRSPRRSLTPA